MVRTDLEPSPTVVRLRQVHADIATCGRCPNMKGPPVHGSPVESSILLLGQAPGPREGAIGKPFAWTAGRTLFRWLEIAFGRDEETVRNGIYIAAAGRCFPGKAPGGGDRRPDREELARCRPFLAREVAALSPRLVLPVGTLAIEEVLGLKVPLVAIIGTQRRAIFHGAEVDVIPLPHPSGASPWPRLEPGKTLLAQALALVAAHPETKRLFG